MEYENIKKAKFVSRPNRFIAEIEINNKTEIAHVKNTGRCRELFIHGADIFVNETNNPLRKTKYDLISVYKGGRLINVDSQAPNKVFHEWLLNGNLFRDIDFIKPEFTYGKSRVDFYIEAGGERILVEVKGVTLEQNGICMFPDAPTERGIKHIKELEQGMKDGYKAYIVFVIQMKGVLYFTPNMVTHPAFGIVLKQANNNGVNVIALDCKVTSRTLDIESFVNVKL